MTEEQVAHASGAMVSLMHGILFLEEGLLKETNPLYPVFTVKVPADMGFVDDHPVGIFFISYEDIFKLFNAKRLDYNLVRLYALQRVMKVNREEKPCVTIADPYYMCEGMLLNPANHSRAKEYLQKFLLDNKSKRNILLPYFPE
jgi:hypothetical protein